MKTIKFLKFGVYLLVILNLCYASIFPYIYKATIWKKWDESLNKHCYVITCSDFHKCLFDDKNNLVKAQLEAIKKLIKNSEKTSLFLVEDSSYYKGGNDIIRSSLPSGESYKNSLDDSNIHILGGITQYIKESERKVKNLECRFYVNLLDSPLFYPDNLASGKSNDIFKLVGNEIMKNFDTTYKNYKRSFEYDSHKELEFYQNFCLNYFNETELDREHAKLVTQDGFSVKEYFENKSNELFNIFLSLSSACFRLLDLKAMEKIIRLNRMHTIFIFMGGAHIYNIEIFLEQAGYAKVIELGKFYFNELYNGKPIFGNSVTSNKSSDFKIGVEEIKKNMPMPIDLTLFQYLKDKELNI